MVHGRGQIRPPIKTCDPSERIARIQRSGNKRHDCRGKRSTQRSTSQTTRMGLHSQIRRQDHRPITQDSFFCISIILVLYNDKYTIHNKSNLMNRSNTLLNVLPVCLCTSPSQSLSKFHKEEECRRKSKSKHPNRNKRILNPTCRQPWRNPVIESKRHGISNENHRDQTFTR